jgi:hypothetical protein
LKDSEGNVIGVLAIGQDITDRKRMEEELQKVQKLESLGLLAGGIAHDFNNLMGGIFGYIDIASNASKDSKVTSYLSKAAVVEIRKLNKEIPVFVASGYANDPVMRNPVEYGFMASICKPFRKVELSEMLNNYLKTNK